MRTTYLSVAFALVIAVAGCGERKSGEPATRAGDPQEAEPQKSAMTEAGIPLSAPSDAVFRRYLEVQNLIDRGDFFAAHDAAVDLTETAPDYIGSWLMLGNAAFSGEEFVKATRRAQELKGGATSAEALWADVNMSFVTNDTDEGLERAKQLVEDCPDSARAHMILAGLYTAQARHEAAREVAARAVELAPQMAATHVTLGFQYMNNEPKDQALAQEHFRHAIELVPDEDNFWVNLGDSHRAQGDLETAASDYSRALELDPGNSVAAVKRGHVNSFLGNYEQARADYDSGIAVAGGQQKSTLANYRAFVHLHAGNTEAALAELNDVNEGIDTLAIPDHQKLAARSFVLTNIADVAFFNGLDEVAKQAVDELTETLGRSGSAAGDEDFARQQKATGLFWQGKLAAELGDYATAAARAEEFAQLMADDQNPRRMERYHELLGQIAMKQGDYATAVEELRQANLSTAPGAGDVKNPYMLALALAELGQDAEAAELRATIANWNFNSVWFAMLRDKVGKASS